MFLTFRHRRTSRSSFRLTVLVALTGAAAVLSGCRENQPESGTAVVAPVGSFVEQWRLPLELSGNRDAIRGLYLRDDTLFVYTQRNRVIGIAAATGKITFGADVTPDDIPLKPPIAMKDRYCFPAGSTVECYDKAGKKIETVDAGRSIRSPGTPSGTTIYMGLDYPGGGRLAALDLTRKYDRARWEAMTFGGVSAAPAVYQATVYLGSEDGRVYAVNELDKAPIWPLEHSAFQTDGKILADLRADEGGVYVASTDSKLYCLELGTGKIKWQYYAAAPITEAPVVTTNSIYLVVPGSGVVALDKNEGKYNREPRWIIKNADRYLAEDEKNVYLKLTDNSIAGFDKATGQLRFSSTRRDLIALAINSNEKDSTIYGATRDGLILGIKPVIKPGTVGTLVMTPLRTGTKDEG